MTDAVKAGQGPATLIGKLVSNWALPCFVWFYVWPAIFGQKNKKQEDPDALPEEPTTWFMFVTKFIIGGLILFTLLLVMIYVKQESMLYVPGQPFQFIEQNPERWQSPSKRDIPFEDVTIITDDKLKLHGWFMRPETGYQKRTTVVFLHENAGNIGLRLDYFEILYKKVGVNVLSVGYRGYGRSEGVPSEAGLQLDAKAIATYVKNSTKIDKKRVFLIGRSLGGGVGLHLISYLNGSVFRGAIIENTWTTMSEMADQMFPFLALIKSIKNKMLKLNWDNLAQVKKITSPILFITGSLDSFVPTEMTRRLHKECKSEQKELWVVLGGNHNDTFMVAGEEYITRLQSFFEKYSSQEVQSQLDQAEETKKEK